MVIKQNVANGIVRGLANFWKCEELQDFTVTLGTVHFGCHRLLLAACSEFFRGLIRSEMKETEQKNVAIKDISSETFELILETIYTGHGVLTNDNVIDIWRAAHQLQILFLVSECENIVINTLSIDNYAEYFSISNALKSYVVMESVWPLVLKNCNAFFETNYFLQLPMDDVISLIKCQDLETTSEDDVIDAILKWVEFQEDHKSLLKVATDDVAHSGKIDQNEENKSCSSGEKAIKKSKQSEDISTDGSNPGNKEQMNSRGNTHTYGDVINTDKKYENLTNLLSHARTCLASQGCLRMLVNHSLVREVKEAKVIVSDALSYQLQVGRRNGQWPSRAVHRNNSDCIHCLVNAEKDENYIKVSLYYLERKEWHQLPYLVGVGAFELVGVGSKLYALCTKKLTAAGTRELLLFQFQKGHWLNIKISLILSSDDFFVALVDSIMYIFSEHEKTVWKLDSSSQKVTQILLLTDHEGISYVMSYDQSILIFYAEGVEETVVYCFDTSLNTWNQLNNLKGPAIGMTSFKDDHFTYLLQSNGDMWKVVKPQSNTIEYEFVVKLWTCDWPLYGAVTFMDELYIHGTVSDDLDNDLHVRRSLPGVFSKINYIQTDSIESSRSIPCILDRKSFFFSKTNCAQCAS